MTDIVPWLRTITGPGAETMHLVADEIERLRAERDELLTALRSIVWEATPDARESARAAIAKAEGQPMTYPDKDSMAELVTALRAIAGPKFR